MPDPIYSLAEDIERVANEHGYVIESMREIPMTNGKVEITLTKKELTEQKEN